MEFSIPELKSIAKQLPSDLHAEFEQLRDRASHETLLAWLGGKGVNPDTPPDEATPVTAAAPAPAPEPAPEPDPNQEPEPGPEPVPEPEKA